MAPHLLILPREICDNIYQYVYHPVHFKRKWRYARASYRTTSAYIELAPIPSALLTCSRLSEEYREINHVRNIRTVLEATLDDDDEWANSENRLRRCIEKILVGICHVTLKVNTTDVLSSVWDPASRLAGALDRNPSYLHTFQVLLYDIWTNGTERNLRLLESNGGRPRVVRHGIHPRSFGLLHLRQYAQGYSVDGSADDLNRLILFDYAPDPSSLRLHCVYITNACLYCRECDFVEMQEDVVFIQNLPQAYNSFTLTYFEDAEINKINGRLGRPLGWFSPGVETVTGAQQRDEHTDEDSPGQLGRILIDQGRALVQKVCGLRF